MNKDKLPHRRVPDKQQQQQPIIISDNITKAVHAEPRNELSSKVHGFGNASIDNFVWPGNRLVGMPFNIDDPSVVKVIFMAWNDITG